MVDVVTTNNKPGSVAKLKHLPENVRQFLTNTDIQDVLKMVAGELKTDVVFIGAHASMESGWLEPHNAALKNLFGLTKGGGKNIQFSSLMESGKTYINAAAVNGIRKTKVSGAKTIQEFADQIQSPDPYRYNSVDIQGYSNKLIKQYNYYVKAVACLEK